MTTRQITMGAGLVPPQHSVDAGTGTRPGRVGRRLLGATAVASPALFAACVAIDPAPLPREKASEFLGAIADHTGAYVAAASFQLGAMATGIALAVAVFVALGDRFPRMAGVASVLLVLGNLGGAGFVGAKLVAADLTEDGAVRPGAEEVWSAVHSGPMFDVLTWPLVMALPGTLLFVALLFRARALVGVWPGPAILVGFVMSSGEFADPVTLAGWVLQVPAVAVFVWRTLRH